MKSMTLRLVAILLSVALLGACSDKEEKKAEPAPAAPQMSDSEAIIGTWQSGQVKIKLNGSGQYVFDMPRPCGAPPCPMTRKSGTYRLEGGKLHLTEAEGRALVMDYKISWEPRSLFLRSPQYNQEWNLPYTGK